ncbi:divalent metal cation transporter (plasmid) [Mesorhizobium sp. AR07]|uniref:NRAMP family divalent metal transporter n=1 Tax=Mesorhizobium sp. AR07 TaxID=2865838 RepID=UPI00215F5C04|nr:NRAMP family divalent metal transporter [Mesorhizobium sp. AR07]UVK49435.1 divalent metal cation transporter [Mesorhizobium sp. AR07]
MSHIVLGDPVRSVVLDSAHLGDIHGAFGTIYRDDTLHRRTWKARLATLMAIIGPGLIVMVGDNDAGAFGTYTQAGQNYGTALLWTLLLLVPVLYVNQEMVLRLGAVTGVGHARLILERFGKFWGAFSVIDLFILNGLTIVTEFIGVNLALGYLGIPRVWGIVVAAGIVIAAASTGNFRRFERFSLALCFFSLLLVPVFMMVHPPLAEVGRDFVIPRFPADGKLSDVMLLIIAIVGTTVAPWQLFFQQSYVIDKRITPRFMNYAKADLVIGIVLVLIGGVAMMAFAAAAFQGTPGFGQFTDAGAVAAGLEAHAGRAAGVMFALALLDASIIGASAVSLATAYAIGDVLALRHSLHRKATDARGFYAVYAGLIAVAAALVLFGSDALLGLLTNAVQTLAGVLLPSATVFLLLLCNDKAVLGPWVNGRWLNVFTGAVIWVLVMLSIILTAATVFPNISGETILIALGGGTFLGIAGFAAFALFRRNRGETTTEDNVSDSAQMRASRVTWTMPPLDQLPPPRLSLSKRLWMGVLRAYLVAAVALVAFKVIQIAVGQ